MSLTYATAWAMPQQILAQFNVYHPFPDSSAVWGMTTGCIDNMCGDWAYIQNYIAGDTMINGLDYKKIQEIYLPMSGNNCCVPPADAGAGYLREDTAARKVYWRDMQSGSESLLYDFTMGVGDTLQGYLFDCNPGISTVVSVDSILVGMSYRRRINIDSTNSCSPFSLIEGVGSSTGLTGCYYSPFSQIGTALTCFTVEGGVFYTAPCGPPDLVPCGTLPVTVANGLPTERKAIVISPNPAIDRVAVDLVEDDFPAVITIYDMFGSEVIEQTAKAHPVVIDMSWLAAGTYIIRSQAGDGGSSFGKIIKQ